MERPQQLRSWNYGICRNDASRAHNADSREFAAHAEHDASLRVVIPPGDSGNASCNFMSQPREVRNRRERTVTTTTSISQRFWPNGSPGASGNTEFEGESGESVLRWCRFPQPIFDFPRIRELVKSYTERGYNSGTLENLEGKREVDQTATDVTFGRVKPNASQTIEEQQQQQQNSIASLVTNCTEPIETKEEKYRTEEFVSMDEASSPAIASQSCSVSRHASTTTPFARFARNEPTSEGQSLPVVGELTTTEYCGSPSNVERRDVGVATSYNKSITCRLSTTLRGHDALSSSSSVLRTQRHAVDINPKASTPGQVSVATEYREAQPSGDQCGVVVDQVASSSGADQEKLYDNNRIDMESSITVSNLLIVACKRSLTAEETTRFNTALSPVFRRNIERSKYFHSREGPPVQDATTSASSAANFCDLTDARVQSSTCNEPATNSVTGSMNGSSFSTSTRTDDAEAHQGSTETGTLLEILASTTSDQFRQSHFFRFVLYNPCVVVVGILTRLPSRSTWLNRWLAHLMDIVVSPREMSGLLHHSQNAGSQPKPSVEEINYEFIVHSLEVIVCGVEKNVHFPDGFLRKYISAAMRTHTYFDERHQQSKWIRLLCVFLRRLIEEHRLKNSSLILEIQRYCVECIRIREAAVLFRMLKLKQTKTSSASPHI